MTNYFLRLLCRSSSRRTEQQNFQQYNFNKIIQQKKHASVPSSKVTEIRIKSVRIVLRFFWVFFFHFFFLFPTTFSASFFSFFFFNFFQQSIVTCPLTYTPGYSLVLVKQQPVMNGSDESPFYDLNLSSQIKKGINLKLTILTEHFCHKQHYTNGINDLR